MSYFRIGFFTFIFIFFLSNSNVFSQILFVNKFEVDDQEFIVSNNELPEFVDVGQQIKVFGTVFRIENSENIGIPNINLEVHDAIGMVSSSALSDQNGEFVYETTVVQDNLVKGPRSITFIVPENDNKTLINFYVSIPPEVVLTSNENLNIFLPKKSSELELDIDLEIFEYKSQINEEYIFSKPLNDFTNIFSINDKSDVSRDNYHHVIRQFNYQQTNPFANNVDVLQEAYKIRDEIRKEESDEIFNEFKEETGTTRLIVYGVGTVSCLATKINPVFGPKSCAIIASMAKADYVKFTGTALLMSAGASEEHVDIFQTGTDYTFLAYELSQPERLTSLNLFALEKSAELGFIETDFNNSYYILEQGTLAHENLINNPSSTSNFENVQYEKNGDFFEFSFTLDGKNYESVVRIDNYITEPRIGNSVVSPESGNTETNFTFNLDYQSDDNIGPDKVSLFFDGTSYDMITSSTDFSNGVTYEYSVSNLAASQYYYHFEVEKNGEIYRYPSSGVESLKVTQSATGWDLAISSNTSFTPASPQKGNTITVEAVIDNDGASGNVYTNETITAKLISPNGSTIDQNSTVLSSISPGDRGLVNIVLDLNNNTPDGNYKIIVSTSPSLDSNIDNNSITLGFYVGEFLGTDIFESINGEELVVTKENNNSDIINDNAISEFEINGPTFEVTNIKSDFIWVRYNGETTVINTGEMAVFPEVNGAIILYSTSIDFDATTGTIERLSSTEQGPEFSTTNLFIEQGGTGKISIVPPSSANFQNVSRLDVISGEENPPYNYENWLDNTDSNGDGSYDLIWEIPSDVNTGQYEMYIRNEYSGDKKPTFVKLNITVTGPLPSVDSLSDNIFSSNETIQILGSNFGGSQGSVKFEDINGNVSSWSDTKIDVVVPENAESGSLIVVNNQGPSNAVSYQIEGGGSFGAPFVTIWNTENGGASWNTENEGVTDDNQIRFPGIHSINSSYTISWVNINNSNLKGTQIDNSSGVITLPEPGIYQVSITGDLIGLSSFNRDNNKLLSIEQWGDIKWERIAHAFAYAENLRINAEDAPDLSNVTDLSGLFVGATSLNDDISHWDISSIEDMDSMFRGAKSFNQDIGVWDTGKVTDMSLMFEGATAFNQNIGVWNVGNVKNMRGMFQHAKLFDQEIGSWDVSNVEDMYAMFADAENFNQDLSAWNTGNVLDMGFMFSKAFSFNQDISNWDVSSVQDMSVMFQSAESFNQDIGAWNVGNVTDMSSMFNRAINFNQDISEWDVKMVKNMNAMFNSAKEFNQDISKWDVSNVKNMSIMFTGAIAFNQDISNWDVSNVQNMAGMLRRATAFDQDLGNWNINNVFIDPDEFFPSGMDNMLTNSGLSLRKYDSTLKGWANQTSTPTELELGAEGLTYCDEVSRNTLINDYNWTITGDELAAYCGEGGTIPFITTWKTDNEGVSEDNQIKIFAEGTDYLIEWEEVGNPNNSGNETATDDHTITFPSAGTYQVSISGDFHRIYFPFHYQEDSDRLKLLSVESWGDIEWSSMNQAFAGVDNLKINAEGAPDLSIVSSMRAMFSGADKFNSEVGHWDVSNVSNMSFLFERTLFNQDIESWNTENVTSMSAMFRGVESFNQDISSWNLSKVRSINEMFGGASSFDQDISEWDVSNVENFTATFLEASQFNQDISNWNIESATTMWGMFDRAISFNQDLSSWNVQNVENMNNLLNGSGLSRLNYDKILSGWANHQNTPTGIELGADGLSYCDSESRDILINTYNWTITGDELATTCGEEILSQSYSKGWNLAGIPVQGSAIPYTSLFTNAEQSPYIFEGTYSSTENIEAGHGYWVNLSANETVEFDGDPIESLELNLDEGWNLVSGIGSSLDVEAIEDSENILSTAWHGFDGTYTTAQTLDPGLGYWIKTNQAGTLTLQQQSAKDPSTGPLADLENVNLSESFNKIIFSSGSDTLQALYFNGELPQGITEEWFQMPPLPPKEAFDARVSGLGTSLTENKEFSISLQGLDPEKDIEVRIDASEFQMASGWNVIQKIDGQTITESELFDDEHEVLYSSEVDQIVIKKSNSLLGEDGSIEQPITYTLEQNYPNPFNPTTQIAYQLPEQQSVLLEVYDMLGRRVTQLVNETQDAGRYNVTFDASNLTSGVYIYRLNAGSYTAVRRLLLVK